MRSSLVLLAGLVLCAAFALPARSQCSVQVLGASGGIPQDEYGRSLAASGVRALVGAPGRDVSGWIDAGAVYVLEQAGGAWSESAFLVGGEPTGQWRFGASVALSGDVALIGSPRTRPTSCSPPYPGAAYVFEFDGSAWQKVVKLAAPGGSACDDFGGSVAVEADIALVGAARDATGGTNTGAAYVFARSGSTWTLAAKLAPAGLVSGDAFGHAVALANGRAFVGAPDADDLGNGSGAVYVFERGPSGWEETGKILASDGTAEHFFGGALAASGDRLLVGAPGDDGAAANSGAVYVCARSQSSWIETQKLEPSHPLLFGGFGRSIALSGGLGLVGSSGVTATPFAPMGWLYVFEDAGSGFVEKSKHVDAPGDYLLGDALALAGTKALAGLPAYPPNAQGKVFAFEADPPSPATISGTPAAISLSAGGVHTLTTSTCGPYGGEVVVVLGSTSGTSPGMPAGGLLLPLNYDGYTEFVLANPNQPPLSGQAGFLVSPGTKVTKFTVPPGTDASLAGVTVHHAAVLLDTYGLTITMVTNAEPVALVP